MESLLIVGYGDIAHRVERRLGRDIRRHVVSRRVGKDLDRPETIGVLPPSDAVLHCAPPPAQGEADPRTAHLLASLERGRILPTRVVYIGTSGVYGDCGGARVDESRPPRPQTPRAWRRLDAETMLAAWCARWRVALVILRAPGIYAADRLPLERLRRAIPVYRPEDDVYTNHVHADDLAGIALRALAPDAPAGIYNACDDSELRMGDWLDLVADRAGLPRPPRVARADADGRIPAMTRSFMDESRRLQNARLKCDLGYALCYPTVHDGVPRLVEGA